MSGVGKCSVASEEWGSFLAKDHFRPHRHFCTMMQALVRDKGLCILLVLYICVILSIKSCFAIFCHYGYGWVGMCYVEEVHHGGL